MSSKIIDLHSLEILDSRGNPTVRTFVTLENGITAAASVPSGASTGTYEAVELRDNDLKRYSGKGVLHAVENVNTTIRNALVGMDISDPRKIDQKMLQIDGTENKSRLGANAILSVSEAIMRAIAFSEQKTLWQVINSHYFFDTHPTFPRLMVNIVNGGKHANWAFDIQEFMILPKPTLPSESIRMAAEIFHSLGQRLKNKSLSTLVGDEGGYAPALSSNEAVFEEIQAALQFAGYNQERDVDLGLDAAASEWFQDGAYYVHSTQQTLTSHQLLEYFLALQNKYHIYSLEDSFNEEDWDGFSELTKHAHNFLTVGDDLYATNPKRLVKGIDIHATNTILIKPNQIGTIMETVDAISMARKAGMKIVISHRSGETEDSFISDLAYGSGADFIKAGSMSRSDRLTKYNRLLEIEKGL